MVRFRQIALLAVAPAALLAAGAHAQDATSDQTPGAGASQEVVETAPPPTSRAPVVVTGKRPKQDDFRPKLDHIMPEVAGTQITVGKKATVIRLDQQPTIVGNNVQQLFNRAPGVLVTQQQTPSQFNLSYRGLGNPQESEFVLVLQDGIPISTDWIGFPTLYYLPMPQSISEVQVIRGGSSLLYGPEPAPAINFVSKRPHAGDPLSAGTEQVAGAYGLYSTYNFVQGSSGPLLYRADVGYVRDGGQRDNGESKTLQGDLYLGYAPAANQVFFVDLKGYRLSAGDPGKETIAQYNADPDFSPTPYNHDWVDRVSGTLGYTGDLTDKLRVEAKGWAAYQDLANRSAAALSASGTAPASTVLQDTVYKSEGLDVRMRQRWGHGSAFTLGAVVYHDNSPFRQWTDADLYADRNEHDTPRDIMARSTNYQSVFAENIFRFGQFHITPSFRLDHETLDIEESVKPAPSPTEPSPRPLYDVHDERTIPNWGVSLGNDFGHMNETYFSVSSGWRPLRYYDVASPFGNLQPGYDPDPPRSIDWEVGVHGTPIAGLWYDVGLFWIDFKNRIETQVIGPNPTDTINVNSGDTRNRGFEGELSYDFLANRGGASHLIASGNLQLLDAKFTGGVQFGHVPAFAPKVVGKYGLTWREDKRYDISLMGISMSSQYFQDSNTAAVASGVITVPAKVPGYTELDLAGDWYITPNVRILAGVTNLTDKRYYNRVFQNGIEPAPARTGYVGVALGF